MSIIYSTNDPDLACRLLRAIKDIFPQSGSFLSLMGGTFDIDVNAAWADKIKQFLVDDCQNAETLEGREAECMAVLNSDDAMDSNGGA